MHAFGHHSIPTPATNGTFDLVAVVVTVSCRFSESCGDYQLRKLGRYQAGITWLRTVKLSFIRNHQCFWFEKNQFFRKI